MNEPTEAEVRYLRDVSAIVKQPSVSTVCESWLRQRERIAALEDELRRLIPGRRTYDAAMRRIDAEVTRLFGGAVRS